MRLSLDRLYLSEGASMITITQTPEELSSFVRKALQRLSPTSKIVIEHVSGDTDIQTERALITPELLRILESTLTKEPTQKPHDTYLGASTVARMLGVKTATLAKWRRQGRGPNGAIRTSATSVSYPSSSVHVFMNSWSKEGYLHADQSNRLHGSSTRPEVGSPQ
jgi:hypothetical protein